MPQEKVELKVALRILNVSVVVHFQNIMSNSADSFSYADTSTE